MIIIFPTETCYGIGCPVFEAESVKKIFEIKNRDEGKCLPVVVHDFEQWMKIAVPNELAIKLAEKYWPGPLTLITKKRKEVPDEICKKTIACRISSHPVVREITEKCGPFIATSANISGEQNPDSLDKIPEKIKKEADRIIDGGKLHTVSSTVYNCINKKIVRKGPIIPEVV